jgi:hypothetical protein
MSFTHSKYNIILDPKNLNIFREFCLKKRIKEVDCVASKLIVVKSLKMLVRYFSLGSC